MFLRRRLGSDRAVWIYGIGLGGAGIYYVVHLERVPETGRLRFIDVSEAQERELGLQTQLQTLKEYDRALLPPNHPVTKRVRKIAQRIVEGSNLGRMKSGGEMSTIEGSVPNFGKGGDMGDIDMGEVLLGGSAAKDVDEGKDTEWEVSSATTFCSMWTRSEANFRSMSLMTRRRRTLLSYPAARSLSLLASCRSVRMTTVWRQCWDTRWRIKASYLTTVLA